MRGKLLLAAVAGLAAAVAVGVAPAWSATRPVPLRGAFYYPWFPQNWTQQGIYPYTQYTPSLGFYDSGNQTLIARHVKALQYANVDVGIYSWWGTRIAPDGATLARFPLYLKASRNTALKWAVYYEEEGYRDPTPDEIAADLRTIVGYASDRAYLRVDGKPVVFVYEGAGDGCTTNDRWAQANAGVGAYLVQDQVWVNTQPRLFGFVAADPATATTAVRVAAADVDGNGSAEVVTAQGPGAAPQVRISSRDAQILTFTAFDAGFLGGVNVAAGDVTGDGRAEVVVAQESVPAPPAPEPPPATPPPPTTTTTETTTTTVTTTTPTVTTTQTTLSAAPPQPLAPATEPTVPTVLPAAPTVTSDTPTPAVPAAPAAATTATIKVYAVSGGAPAELVSFDSGLPSARVAIGDVNGDGKAEIVAAAGPGGPPMVRVFDTTGKLLSEFAAYDVGYTGGVNVAVGNVAGDSRPDIVTGGATGIDDVRVFGATGGQLMAPFAPYGGLSGGVSVAVGDTDGNGTAEIVTEAVNAPRVLSFTTAGGLPSQLASFYAFDRKLYKKGVSFVASADVDGNKRADVVVSSPELAPLDKRAEVAAFGSVRDCASQPQSWHEYNFDATGSRAVPGESVTISPGFFSRSEAQPRVARDLTRWTKQVRDSVASQAKWQLLISFNEWGEGTAVESATAWASRSGYGSYVDVLHANP